MVQVSGVNWRRESSCAARSSAEGSYGSVSERAFGREHERTLGLRWTYANLLREDSPNGQTQATDLVEAYMMMESVAESWRRRRPKNDPDLLTKEKTLKLARDDLNRIAEYFRAAGREDAVEALRQVVGDVIRGA